MLELHKVSKRFGDTVALHEVCLRIAPGQTTALIGPSGCGKSTVLRLLIGLLRPDHGQVSFNGRTLENHNLEQVRHKMGYVIQEGGLFPHMSAADNITLMADHLGWDSRRQQNRVDELLALTKFPREGLARFPLELSGGQRQRVGLMRALMMDPDVLLLDEPLGALDPMIRSELQEDLRLIFTRLEKTVVLVTHDLGEAAYLADSIVLMRSGRIVQSGSLDDFVQNPAEEFVRAFLNAQRSPLALQNGQEGEGA